MKRFAWIVLAFLAIFSTAACSTAGRGTAGAAAEQFDIPRLDNITIDGDASDWKDGGFRINMLTSRMGKVKAVNDLDARARLAYDQRGLLFLLTVRDEVACEHKTLWEGDSVELFIADLAASPDRYQYQVVIAPGMDSEFPEPRLAFMDQRSEELKKVALAPEYGRKPLLEDGKTVGYVLEMRLPWEQLGMTVGQDRGGGRKVGFQFVVNDLDAPRTPQFRLIWFPQERMHEQPGGMHTLRLSDRASPAIDAVANVTPERFRRTVVTVLGTEEAAGTTVAAEMGGVKVEGVLSKKNGRSESRLILPLPEKKGDEGGGVKVSLEPRDGNPGLSLQQMTTLTLHDLNESRWREFMNQRLHFAAIFTTPEFPKFDFAQPSLVEDIIGRYEIVTTFYDADYREVTTADKPGRYGAIVTITNEHGFSTRRFRTLYRTAEDSPWLRPEISMTMALRKEFGIDPTVLQEQQGTVRDTLRRPAWDLMREQGLGGDLFAGLAETKPGSPPATVYDNIHARNNAWWLPLKRKLYGSDKQFTTAIQNPVKFAPPLPPATVLRVGTLAEAGMKPGTTEKLDELLKQWAADSDQGFNVCVARNGVIVLHGAYGERDGKPFTTETKSPLASITKVFSGTAMMMAVDQGLISLDDPIDKYLPPFQNKMTKAPTIRQLYTHTAGMWDWYPEIDLAETLSACAPYYKAGQNHTYNGTSLTLGSSILELVSGEVLSTYYQKRLFVPLGMKHMDATDSSGGASGTAYDLAILAQMLLNKGSYGNLRFMREETFAEQLPHRLTKELSPTTTMEWGIGLACMDKEKTAIGHGSASNSIFRFHPSQNLVVTMARNGAGKNFGKYFPQFIQLVQDCLE